jgi:hypothetical protein
LPRLHHGIAQIHNLELDRHNVPLVELRGLRKYLPARANLLLCTPLSISSDVERMSLRAYSYGYP